MTTHIATIPNTINHPLNVHEIDDAVATCINALPKKYPDTVLLPIQMCAVDGGLVILVQMQHS